MQRAINVFLVEDYKLVRVGLISLIKADPDFRVVGECETAEEALVEIPARQPDVVLMDVGLPGMSGIEATKKLRGSNPDMKVIMLTSHDNEEEVLASLNAGANAYCLKDIPSQRLLEVIRAVHEGAAWLDPGVAKVVLEAVGNSASATASETELEEDLTQREQQVLKLLVEGKSNSEIADEIYVSVHSVKVYVSNILRKLAVNDRVQAAVKAVKGGIV